MADNDIEPTFDEFVESDAEDLKKKIAEQSLKSAEQVQEDPSRSSLHYGEGTAPEQVDSEAPSGAQTAGDARQNVDASEPGIKETSADAGAQGITQTTDVSGGLEGSGSDVRAPAESSRGAARRGDIGGEDTPGIGPAQASTSGSPVGQAARQTGQSSTQTDLPSKPEGHADQPVFDVNDAPTEVGLSNTAVAENAEGAVVGRLTVSDQDVGDSHSFEVSDDRFEVVDGTVKLKEGVSLSHDEAATLTLEVTATDVAGASVTQSFDIAVVDMPDISVDTGFHAKYFDVDHRLKELSDVDWQAEPTHQELVREINYQNSSNSFWEGGSKDTFGVELTGNIEVTEAGSFDFFIGGDDGVVLYVNGVEVIDNDGLHGFRTRSGEIDLEPGTHSIEVRYFENTGRAGLKLEWEGPGIEGRELVGAPEISDLQTVSGMPVAIELNIEDGDASATHSLQGLPPGSIVTLEDQILEVGETGSVDVTGMDFSLVQITPPIDFTGDISASLTTTVSLGEGGVATQEYPITIDVDAAEIPPPIVDVFTGFKASYFDVDHSLKRLDDINWDADPTHEEMVSEVNYTNSRESFWEGGSKDTFGAKVTGEVTVEEGGVYEFFVGGDDGVVLFINGEEVVNNDGLQSYKTGKGEIELEPGTHEIEVRYFENHGHAGLKLEWEGPDTNGREIMRADTEIDTQPNGAVEIRLDTPNLGEDGYVTLSGLPEDTILVSGEMTAVSDGSEITLQNWNLDLIEIMPPAEFNGDIQVDVTVMMEAFNGAMVQSSSSFEILVDGDGASGNGSESPDAMLLIDQADGGEGSDAGWLEGAEQNDGDASGGDDDVMQENVANGPEAEQSNEVPESYERQDW